MQHSMAAALGNRCSLEWPDLALVRFDGPFNLSLSLKAADSPLPPTGRILDC